MVSKYFVVNENTLCYQQDGMTNYGIIAGKPQKGGRTWQEGCFNASLVDTIREATKKDFDDYRVCSKGYFSE